MEADLKKKRTIFGVLSAILIVLVVLLFYFLGTGEFPDEIILKNPKYLYSIYGAQKVGALNQPLSATVENGRLFVTDSGNSRIVVFDLRGRTLFTFNKVGNERLSRPNYIASKDGRIYVSDSILGGVFIFNTDGKFTSRFKLKADSKFRWAPLALAFNDKGDLFVTDKGANRLLKFNNQGELVLELGKTGIADTVDSQTSKFYFPNGIAFDNNRIFVSDSNNRRVQVFNSKGKFISIIGTGGLPRGITYYYNKLLVVNSFNHYVQVYDSKGKKLFNFGGYGIQEGQFQYPNDIAIAGKRLYIVDSGNNRVQVWLY